MASTFEALEAVFRSINQLCAPLPPADYERPTAVPGWSVKDNLSHLVAIERRLAGEAGTKHVAAPRAWVKNPLGEANENEVDYRRGRPGPEVLDEFRKISETRLEQVGGLSTDELAQETDTPLGRKPLGEFLAIRIVDLWVHEQDMRRALGSPGHLSGITPTFVLDRLTAALPMVLAKRTSATDGTGVQIDVPGYKRMNITIDGGRASFVQSSGKPNLEMTLDTETLNALMCGRWDPVTALEAGRITWRGDATLLHELLSSINIMF